MRLFDLAVDKKNVLCIVCQKTGDMRGIQTDKGVICEDHLAKTDWQWEKLSPSSQGKDRTK